MKLKSRALRPLVVAALILAGCSGKGSDLPPPPDDTAGTTPGTTETDDTTAPELDCEETGVVQTVEAERSAVVSTVVTVRWTTSEPVVSQVLYGDTPNYGMETGLEAEPATEHEAVLRGLSPNGDWHFRVVVDDGSVHCSDDTEVETGAIPSWLAEVSVSDYDPARSVGGYVAASVISVDLGSSAISLYDMEGNYVWYYSFEEGAATRVRLSQDGEWILFNVYAWGADVDGYLYRVSWDGETVERILIPGMHDDFVELPGGDRYATLRWNLKDYEYNGATESFVGTEIIEFDHTGEYTVVWDIYDWLEPDLTEPFYPGLGEDDSVKDWIHINSLHYDEVEDDYLVSGFFQHTVLNVDRDTGALQWALGGEMSDFDIGDAEIYGPHNVAMVDGDVLLFDHGDTLDCSRAARFTLDTDAGTAEESWSYFSEDCLLVYFFGAVSGLENGNVQVTWSTAGQLDEVTQEGELVWRLQTEVGAGFGYTTRLPTLFP